MLISFHLPTYVRVCISTIVPAVFNPGLPAVAGKFYTRPLWASYRRLVLVQVEPNGAYYLLVIVSNHVLLLGDCILENCVCMYVCVCVCTILYSYAMYLNSYLTSFSFYL